MVGTEHPPEVVVELKVCGGTCGLVHGSNDVGTGNKNETNDIIITLIVISSQYFKDSFTAMAISKKD